MCYHVHHRLPVKQIVSYCVPSTIAASQHPASASFLSHGTSQTSRSAFGILRHGTFRCCTIGWRHIGAHSAHDCLPSSHSANNRSVHTPSRIDTKTTYEVATPQPTCNRQIESRVRGRMKRTLLNRIDTNVFSATSARSPVKARCVHLFVFDLHITHSRGYEICSGSSAYTFLFTCVALCAADPTLIDCANNLYAL